MKNQMARLWRQLVFVPILHNKWLTPKVKASLCQKIEQAEQGHQGEIRLIIENHLPILTAYHQSSHDRALDLFSMHKIWDTQYNTGILVYLNICEKSLNIIADRGINDKVDQGYWQELCDKAVLLIGQNKPQTALEDLIDSLGGLLRCHYPAADTSGNELPNEVTYLR